MSDIDVIEKQIGDNPEFTIIWLHGLGADGNDFVPVIDALGLIDKSVRFVFPHAPVRPITINGGMPMRGWYDIKSLEFIREEDSEGFENSSELIEKLIEKENIRGISTDRIILAGFSQGGALALYHGLRRQKPLAAIIALSCYLPFPDNMEQLSSEAKNTPIFMAHGEHDEVVIFDKGLVSATALMDQNYNIVWKTYPLTHSVNIEEIQDIGGFINNILEADDDD